MAYKIRRITKEDGSLITASLGIPNEIAAELPSDVRFDVELTDEGILFRPAAARVSPTERPKWLDDATSGSNGSSPAAPKRVKATAAK